MHLIVPPRIGANAPWPLLSVAGLCSLALLLILLIGNLRWAPPYFNYDVIGYVGTVYAYSDKNPEIIHRKTFDNLAKHAPPDEYQLITGTRCPQNASTALRRDIAGNPVHFVQQLPFYSVKPIYPGLMYLLDKAGIDPVPASQLISRTAYVGLGLVLFLWLLSSLPPLLALVVAGSMASISHVLELAYLSTPDALSSFCLTAALALLTEGGRKRISLLIFAFAVAIRPDNIVLLFWMALVVAYHFRRDYAWIAASVLLGLAIYLAETRLSGNYGWKTLFYYAFVQMLPEPAGFHSPLALADYLRIYASLLSPRKLYHSLVLFGLLNLLAILLHAGNQDPDRSFGSSGRLWFHLLLANTAYMVNHWLIFPGEKDRLFITSYLLILMALAKYVAALYRTDKAEPSTAPS